MDNLCANCHIPQGEIDFDASIKGSHVVPAEVFPTRRHRGSHHQDFQWNRWIKARGLLHHQRRFWKTVVAPSLLGSLSFLMAGSGVRLLLLTSSFGAAT